MFLFTALCETAEPEDPDVFSSIRLALTHQSYFYPERSAEAGLLSRLLARFE
ncbi:unnamed protein product [Ixodes pacificus]